MTTSPDDLRQRLLDLLIARADRVAGGQLTEASPLELVVRGESVSARIYPRYNTTLVLAIDVYVDDVPELPSIMRWVATRSGVMPFAALHIDRPLAPGTAPAVLLVSHTLVASTVDGTQLDEVLDGLTYMARRARGRVEELTREHELTAPAHTLDGENDDDHDTDEGRDGLSDRDGLDPEDPDDPDDPDDDVPITSSSSERRTANDANDNFSRHAPATRDRAAVLAELEGLIGLQPVKHEITTLVQAQEVAELRRARGLAANTPSPHLVFVGNPGTGKTTVGRLVGELYRAIGLLPSGHLVETDRAGLVAGYLGQTALKTLRVCEQALGGVLFIDEAYTLAGGDRDYGQEAIETLLTFMENHRGELAVVVAGYPDEMGRFISANPGLRSRFDLTIEFPDYSLAELDAIFAGLVAQHDYDLEPEAHQAVLAYMAAWPHHRGFGNGREVRKLFNDITRRHAALIAESRPSTQLLRRIPVSAVPVAPVAPIRRTDHPGYL